MNEPKVPDSNTDWQAVDIFLFSNGQHQTPPRKYHLDTEDLNRWSSTLMILSHAQYGAFFSSIDLYTLEGQRVHTPMEISNGATYVAVPPQDTFIPAGYNDYLLRASRSREKRQNKFNNNTQVELIQDEFDTNIQAIEIEAKEEVENVETLNEEINNVATSAIGDQANTTPKVQPQYSARSNNKTGQLEKLNSNNQHSTILRKQNSSIPQLMIRKTSMKLKDNPVRKNLKVNTLKGTNNGSTIITNNNNQFRPNTKSLTKTGKTSNRDTTLKNSNDRPEIGKKTEPRVSIIGKVMSSTEKIVTTDNTALENVIDDNELIVLKKHDSDVRCIKLSESEKNGILLSSRHTRLSSIPILLPIEENQALAVDKNDTPVTTNNNVTENVNKSDTGIINDITSKNKTKLQINNNIQEQQDYKIKFSKKPPVDSFTAVIDKGDVVNLNLKIEVRKCEGVISTQDSKPINFITEKGSQVNIDQEIVETVAKRSNLSSKLTVDDDNSKVVVIQCACGQNNNLSDILHKIDTGSEKFGNKKYVMLLPDPQCDKSVERSHCSRDENRGREKSHKTRASLVTPLNRVFATTSVQPITTLKTTQDIGITVSNLDSHNANAQGKPEIVDIIDKIPSIQKMYSNSEISTKHKYNVQKTFVDNSTQTGWFTILLEARQHEDGRYSFYFPPLHVLNYYGL